MTALFCNTLLVCIALFILPARTQVTVTTYFINEKKIYEHVIRFTDQHFKQFYKCLCENDTFSCTAHFYILHDTFNDQYYYQYDNTTRETTNQTESNLYKCWAYFDSAGLKFQCKKQFITSTCGDLETCQYFNLKNTGSFDSKFVWIKSYSNQIIIFKGRNLNDTFKKCTPDLKPPESQSEGEHNIDNSTVIIVAVTLSLVILILLVVFGVCLWRMKRKRFHGKSQSPNTARSLHNVNVGYQNTINIRDEETHNNSRVHASNTYSTVDSRNHPTNSSNYATATSDGDSARSASPYSLAAAGQVSGMSNEEGEVPLSQHTSDYGNCLSSSDDNNFSLANTEGVNSQAKDNIQVTNDREASLSTDTNNAYSKLHERATNIRNPYGVLSSPKENPYFELEKVADENPD